MLLSERNIAFIKNKGERAHAKLKICPFIEG